MLNVETFKQLSDEQRFKLLRNYMRAAQAYDEYFEHDEAELVTCKDSAFNRFTLVGRFRSVEPGVSINGQAQYHLAVVVVAYDEDMEECYDDYSMGFCFADGWENESEMLGELEELNPGLLEQAYAELVADAA